MQNKMSAKRIFMYQFATFGIYFFVWMNRSAKDLNTKLGTAEVPGLWWFLLPAGGYWYMWKYAGSLDTVSNSRIKTTDTFMYYVIATVLFGANGIVNLGEDTAIWVYALVVSFGILALIAGHGFCIAMIQSKINKLATV